MKKYLFAAAVIGVVVTSAVFRGLAEDISVTSNFDRRSARVNEEINLKISIAGAVGNVQAPRLPSFQGFDTFYTGRASHITFVNGQSSSNVEFSYVLIPKTPGRFTLQPIDVAVQGRTFRTESVEIEVLAGAPPAAPRVPVNQPPRTVPQTTQPVSQPPLPSAGGFSSPVQAPPAVPSSNDDNIFVQAWVDKPEVYQNQQVLLTYSLYTRYDTRYEGFEEEPVVSGFWIEEFPMERDIEKQTVKVGGKPYVKADVRKMALFPTAAADYTIRPGKIRASIRQQPQQQSIFDDFFDDSFFNNGGFFARRENRLLEPSAIQVKVKPLPEAGKPAGFNGAVGDFRLTASIDKKDIEQNEPVTMTLSIEGAGNIETLNKPNLPELPDFKVYEADTSSQMFKTGVVISGRKTFEVVFIPKKAGNVMLPVLEFSYFNPYQERYVTLKTPDFQLQVRPSTKNFELPSGLSQQDIFKKDVQVESRDIHTIRETVTSGRAGSLFEMLYRGLAGLNIFLTLLFLAQLWRARIQDIYDKDHALRRRRTARQTAAAGVQRLKKRVRKDEEGAVYFQEVDKVLTQYLTDKFNLSAYGGTRFEIEAKLLEILGAEDSLYEEILQIHRICDESRFGQVNVSREEKEKAIDVVSRTVQKVEKLCR